MAWHRARLAVWLYCACAGAQRHARDELLHHGKRSHYASPPASPPRKSRPTAAFLRTRAQHFVDAFLDDRNQSAVPTSTAGMLDRWRAQLEAQVALNLAADVFEGPPLFRSGDAPFDCDGVQVLGVFHKTGTFFASALMTALQEQHGLAATPAQNDAGSLRYDNFSRLARPREVRPGARYMVEVLLPHFGIHELLSACRGARIAVFLRDLVEMVLSGFNYHARLPAPEPWLDWKGGLFANPCSDYVHARTTLKRPNAGLVVSCAVGYYAQLGDNPGITYGSLLRAVPEAEGLRAEGLRALVGAGDAVRQQLWAERVLAGDLAATDAAVFATMAGFYRPGQFGSVARCVLPKLDLPRETYEAATIMNLKRAVILDASAPLTGNSLADHSTRYRNKTHQRHLLTTDPVVGAVLVALRGRLRRLWRSGKLRTCGHFDAEDEKPPQFSDVAWAPGAASDLLRAREKLDKFS